MSGIRASHSIRSELIRSHNELNGRNGPDPGGVERTLESPTPDWVDGIRSSAHSLYKVSGLNERILGVQPSVKMCREMVRGFEVSAKATVRRSGVCC